jgi:hypothetical protein
VQGALANQHRHALARVQYLRRPPHVVLVRDDVWAGVADAGVDRSVGVLGLLDGV